MADRGYCQAAGLAHVCEHGGHLLVRLATSQLALEDKSGGPLDLLGWLKRLAQPGQIGELPVWVRYGQKRYGMRLCAVRKSAEALRESQARLRRRAQRRSQQLRADTVAYAQWILVLTTAEPTALSTAQVLEWYRVRWQVELAFKRLKSLADFGHLPKRDRASSRAWLYGKLLVALLSEKMQRYARAVSPWGGCWARQDPPEELLA